MSVKFIHSADWQLGKPFASIEPTENRVRVQQERFAAIERVGAAARTHAAEFVLVAGDLFDSSSTSKAVVSQACAAIGKLQVPVLVIPGNHDHGGPGCIWEQPFFLQEQAQLAPNLRVLSKPEPVDLGSALLFPCPLLRRHEALDVTAWLRSINFEDLDRPETPRIVLAHGSVQDFGAAGDDDSDDETVNRIDLDRLPDEVFDYIALGDWHGTKQVGSRAWYSGTPENDRFARGEDNLPGNILAVTARRGQPPEVVTLPTARLGWHPVDFTLHSDADLERLDQEVQSLLHNRVGEDLIRLNLDGTLGLEAYARLEEMIERWQARLLRLKLANGVTVAPTDAEIEAMVHRSDDPLISRVAAALHAQAQANNEHSDIARLAMRELYRACMDS